MEEFRQRVIVDKEIKNQGQYNRHRRTDPELWRFPSNPERRYPGFQWPEKGKSSRNRVVTNALLPSVEEFWQRVIVDNNIKSQREYYYIRQIDEKIDEELKRFPSSPTDRYPGFKWPGRIAYITADKLPSEAEFWRVVIVDNDIRSRKEYYNIRKIDEELKRFPSNPTDRYPGFKWPGRQK